MIIGLPLDLLAVLDLIPDGAAQAEGRLLPRQTGGQRVQVLAPVLQVLVLVQVLDAPCGAVLLEDRLLAARGLEVVLGGGQADAPVVLEARVVQALVAYRHAPVPARQLLHVG